MYEITQPTPAYPQQPPVAAVPPVKKSWMNSNKFRIPLIAQIAGALSLLLLIAGLLTAQQLAQNSQDISSMAQQAPAPVMDLTIQPPTKTVAINQEETFKVQINTNGKYVSAAHLILNYDPAFLTISKGNYVAPFTNILHDIDPQAGKTITAVGATAGNSFLGKGDVLSFVIKTKDKKGTTKVTLLGSEAAAITIGTNQAKIAGDLTLTIGDAAPATPSGTICWNRTDGTNWPNGCKGIPADSQNPVVCTTAIVPLTAEEKTAYNAWKQAGSVVPAACQPATVTDPTLNLGFRVQGVTKGGVTKTAEVGIRYKKKNSTEIVKKFYTQNFTSTEATSSATAVAGLFKSTPITLTGVNLDEVDKTGSANPTFGTGIEVFVKTPTSLRKKLGEITYENNVQRRLTGQFVADTSKLVIGDFNRSEGQLNVLRSLDLGRLLDQFVTDVSVPVTEQNKDYDIDNNGVINSFDTSLILSNLKDVSVPGDEL